MVAVPAQAQTAVVGATTVYDSTVTPLPASLPSLGFQATQTSELGDEIQLAGTDRVLRSATVTMVTWAKHSTYPSMSDAGWNHPITLNLYDVDESGETPSVGAKLASVTQTFDVPWRPEKSDVCGDDRWSPDADASHCYHGYAFNITFDLSDVGPAPDDLIYGIAYDTGTWGYQPLGTTGPFDSLNVGLRDHGGAVTGTDTQGDDVFWNTATASSYADGGAAGVGEFRRDTGWAPYIPAISFTAGDGCEFETTDKTMTLQADCTIDQTITVPEGYTLDGDGHTITAVDPDNGHFVGAVLTNVKGASTIRITDVTVTSSGLSNVCDSGGDRLRGILLDGAGGMVDHVTVTGVRQGLSGCQEGNGIEVRNLDASGAAAASIVQVSVLDNVVSDYQKNGITINGAVIANLDGNTVVGDGSIAYIAQNGVQIGFGASAYIEGNSITGNAYSPESYTACGLLMYQADGVKQKQNEFSANERDVCNFGRGGGNVRSVTG